MCQGILTAVVCGNPDNSFVYKTGLLKHSLRTLAIAKISTPIVWCANHMIGVLENLTQQIT